MSSLTRPITGGSGAGWRGGTGGGLSLMVIVLRICLENAKKMREIIFMIANGEV